MTGTDKNSDQNRSKVGVYDRPAGADRARYIRLALLCFAVGVSVFIAYFFWGR